jgi:hypothetical protein
MEPKIAMKKSPLGRVQYIHPKVFTSQFIIFYTLPKAKPFAM